MPSIESAQAWYPQNDPVHGFDHVLRVFALAERIAKAEGAIAAGQHPVRARRFRGTEQPETLEAKVLFDADKLDVIGAFGVARTIAYDVVMGWPIFTEPSQRFRQSGEKE